MIDSEDLDINKFEKLSQDSFLNHDFKDACDKRGIHIKEELMEHIKKFTYMSTMYHPLWNKEDNKIKFHKTTIIRNKQLPSLYFVYENGKHLKTFDTRIKSDIPDILRLEALINEFASLIDY